MSAAAIAASVPRNCRVASQTAFDDAADLDSEVSSILSFMALSFKPFLVALAAGVGVGVSEPRLAGAVLVQEVSVSEVAAPGP